MKTSDIDPCDYKAVCFFKSMDYEFNIIEGDERRFLEATKDLWKDDILGLIRLIEQNKTDLFKRKDYYGSWVSFFSTFVLLFGLELLVLTASIVDRVIVVLALIAVVIDYLSLIAQFFEQNIVDVNYKRMIKKCQVEEYKKSFLKALIKIKAKNREYDLEQIYNMNPSMISREKLLERLFE